MPADATTPPPSHDYGKGPAAGPQFFGHPVGLIVLFATEMWERFSFYGMRALLVLYCTKHFLFSDKEASELYGAYLGLTYGLPIIGGFLADRILGFRRAVVFGGILLCLGHLGMAFEGDAATRFGEGEVIRDEAAVTVFYLSLGLISAGVGFLKPNISAIVGRLYAPNDARRDGGFTIFYMGINIGAAASALIVGYLGETYGWGYGFGVAGIGMVVGLAVFLWGQKYLYGVADAPSDAVLKEKLFNLLPKEYAVYIGGILMVFFAAYMVQREHTVGALLVVALAIAVVYLLIDTARKCTKEERHRIYLVLLLSCAGVLFWALFEQAGSSMNLFTDRVVDRQVGSFLIPTTWFQSLNAIFIIMLAPLFAMMWAFLGSRKMEPNIPVKFGLGILQAGLGFAALVIGIQGVVAGELVGVIWIVLAYLLHTTGELCLSPVGLSMVTKLTVPRLVGLMMGVWFLATAFADWVSGQLAALAQVDTGATGEVTNKVEALAAYGDLFWLLTQMGVAMGIVVLIAAPFMNRLAHGIK